MRKIALLLILLGIFIFSMSVLARENDHFNLKDKDPTQDRDAKTDSRTNFDSWESERKIRQNFAPMRTVPIYHDNSMNVEIGPAQIEFRFAL
ncbi:MAG: hypothetical protein HY877_03450 [Deltaproteobacteria bacterium]|nr:hypothetical protein [Deltaproteobacteria bacterium]